MHVRRTYDPGEVTSQVLAAMHGRALPAVEAASLALLVLDPIAFFFDPASPAFLPATAAVRPAIEALLQAFRAHGLTVVVTRHVDRPGSGMTRFWGRAVGEADAALSLTAAPSDLVLTKSTYDAFHGTDLERVLRERGVRAVAVCGVVTHLCCETTARSALVRDLDVVFVGDATAAHDEHHHTASLRNLGHGVARIVRAHDLIAGLRR